MMKYHVFSKQYAYFGDILICAGNTFLTSKVHSFLKKGYTVNIEWISQSSLVKVVNWPYITMITADIITGLYLMIER